MLNSNLAVDQVTFFLLIPFSFGSGLMTESWGQRFCNGAQGRLLQWHPGSTENKRKAVPASGKNYYTPRMLRPRECGTIGKGARAVVLPTRGRINSL